MAKDYFSLMGKVIVITGGLGQLGSAFTRSILDHSGRVVVLDTDTSDSRIEKTLGEYRKSIDLLVLQAEVTNRKSLEAALAKIQKQMGVPHGLINNAALDAPPNAPLEENGPFENYPEQSWDKVMEVNVKGVLLCSQVFGGAMAKEGRGSVINIGSIYGIISPDQRIYEYRRARGEEFYKPIAYSASKSALLNMTRYLATYWGAKNVRVNSITFGGVFNNQDQAFLTEYEKRVPLGRMARPEDYLGPIQFLLSDASGYMTGANMIVDGGWTAW